MANNLRVFNTNSEYQSADLVHPAVSYVIETDKVIYDYTPPTPPVFQGKWKATYSDSHTKSAQCGSSSVIAYREINTSNLVSVEIGDCVTSIGMGAFSWCLSLTSVTIGDGVTSISEGAFETCSSLTSVTIPSSVTIINNSAFFQCASLTSITVNAVTPPSLIGNLVFESTNNCPIYVPCESVEAYKSASGWSDYASRITCVQPPFEGKWKATYQDSHTESAQCGSSSEIVMGEINLTNLVSVEIGDCVTSIGEYAFYDCTSLTSIDIPSGVTSIGDGAFIDCVSLTRLNSDVDGVFNIPDSVTSIGNDAFNMCTSLTSIVIPSGVTSIGNSAFRYCSSLTSITIGSGVTSIGMGAFYSCNSLTSIDIPSGVTSIGNYAFNGCRSLTSIDIPSGVTSIGEDAFYDCRSLTSITVNAVTPPTLGNMVFENTDDCPIYVPSASLTVYQTAWSQYASRIQAIP